MTLLIFKAHERCVFTITLYRCRYIHSLRWKNRRSCRHNKEMRSDKCRYSWKVKKHLVALRDDNGETGYVAQRYVPQTNEVCAA